MTLPCASPDNGQVKRPFSNLLAQTQSPLPSQTRTFSRLRWPLQNKNTWPSDCARLVVFVGVDRGPASSLLFPSYERRDLFWGRRRIKVFLFVVGTIADELTVQAPF